jgi:hypothetical protein
LSQFAAGAATIPDHRGGRAMTMSEQSSSTGNDRDRDRVAAELASRLQDRGVTVRDDDSADAVFALEEAIERFEAEVQSHGGDLMVDEPPRGHAGRPDDPRYVLPLRHADESTDRYVERIARATDKVRMSKGR